MYGREDRGYHDNRDRGYGRDRDSRDNRDNRDNRDRRRSGGGGGRRDHSGQYESRRYDRHEDRHDDRSKYDEQEEIENRLTSLIVRVGDKSSSSLESNLSMLSEALETDIPKHKRVVIETIVKCALGLPVKTPVYGTLVGLLNANNSDFGEEVVIKACADLQLALTEVKEKDAKYLVRFMAELANASAIQHSSILSLFESFVAVINEDNIPQDRIDFYVQLVLSALPWVGSQLAKSNAEGLSQLLSRIEQYISRRTPRGTLFDAFQYVEDSEAPEPKVDPKTDKLALLWKQVVALQGDDWVTRSILRPYLHFEDKLSSALIHTLSPIKIPTHTVESVYPLPQSVFRVFPAKDSEKDLRPIDRFVVEDYLIDLLTAFESNHKDGVKFMLQLPINSNIDHILIETVFSQLFKLPACPSTDLYYPTVIIDLFKAQHSVIPIFAQAVDAIFLRLDEMDVECVDRFSAWFALHLSNTDYKWSWIDWDFVLDQDDQSPKRRLVSEILEKTMRLAYYERVSQTIPEEFGVLMPPKPVPYFKFEDSTSDDRGKLAKSLFDKIRRKESHEALVAYIDNEIAPKVTDPAERLDVITQSLLQAGSKSFSHILNTIERNISLFNAIVKTSEQKQTVIKSVAEFWQDSRQHIIILLDKLMTYRIVDGQSIVQWIFSSASLSQFVHSYIWDILNNTLKKSLARCDTLTRELESVRETNNDKARTIENNLEQAQKEQKELFVCLFARFATVLAEFTAHSNSNEEPKSLWYKIASGEFKALGRKYHAVIARFMGAIEASLPSDARVVAMFNHFKQIIVI